MIAAPIPANDADRLRELHDLGLLDTAPEERFDRITRLLTLLLDVPIAYISLVDRDRQWFKSARGLEVLQTPRSISFCGHAILSEGPLIVPDAARDERFRDNPQVVGEPFLRFYAGVPLAGPGGHKVGTLCVADVRPRSLTANQVEALRELGRLVEREMGLVEVVQLQRDLIAGQRRLVRELSEAAAYVRSILPAPLDGAVSARWRFEPSSQLGGDCLGYDWIDPDHFAAYLIDVSGHGVGAALLSVSVANVLRSRSLPGTDFLDPAAVLTHLNATFPMDRNDERYLTAWYGVLDRADRKLTYACAGHPAPLLVNGAGSDRPRTVELGSTNFPIGMFPGADFTNGSVELDTPGRLFVFSDGAYEVRKPGGALMDRQDLLDYLGSSPGPNGPDDVWRFVGDIAGKDSLEDDFSVLELTF
jgi:sigma-B regulation protein RsbU (phosphoserine phosphatase)